MRPPPKSLELFRCAHGVPMNQGSSKSFTCPHCQKRFQWSTRIADRKAQCPSCAKRIRIPTVPGRVAEAVDPLPETHKPEPLQESDTYELDLTGIDESIVEAPPTAAQQAAAETGRCPACNQSINPGAVICIKCGYNLKKGKRMQTTVADGDAPDTAPPESVKIPGSALAGIGGNPITRALEDREDEVQPSRFIDLWLPLGLIVIGLAFTIYSSWLFPDPLADKVGWMAKAAISCALQVFVIAPLMLFAATVTVNILSTSFGPLFTGVLKLTAIAVGPLGLADVLIVWLVPGAMGLSVVAAGCIYITVYVIFCAPFLYLMFDLDYTEVMLTTATIIGLRLLVTLGIMALVMSLLP